MIPLCDLQLQYALLREEIDAAMQQVAAAGRYILGPEVERLEQAIAELCGARHAVGVGSGTDALHLALLALGIGPGDEVITTPFTFVATTEAIGLVGAKPVFVDIDPRTFNLDPGLIERAITPRTKAILPVHLYGQPCAMLPIVELAARHDLRVIEDCCQALGAEFAGQRVGTFGDAGCLSFFPSKNLGCFGDGGMLVTSDSALYERVEMLRRHGGKVKYHHTELGLNSRLDELQAAVLNVKLPHLAEWTNLRRQHAYRYNSLLEQAAVYTRPAELAGDGTLAVPTSITTAAELPIRSVYHQYTLLVDDRDGLARALQARGIGSCVYYPVPLHLQPVHASLHHAPGDFPHAEYAARHCLSLPMFPELTREQQDQVVAALLEFEARRVTKAA